MENKEKNVKDVVKSCDIVSAVSKKGASYKVVKIELINGYKEQIFLPNSLSQIIDLLVASK